MRGIDNVGPFQMPQDGTRLEHGVLTPATENSINASGLLSISTSKKRKRPVSSNVTHTGWKEPFTIWPHPFSVFDKPRGLTPLLLIPRVHLPLSSLDTCGASTALPASRLFSSNIVALEHSVVDGMWASSKGPVVLLARLDADRSRYAVERVERGVYALCKLGDWVKAKELRANALDVNEEGFARHHNVRKFGDAAIPAREQDSVSERRRLSIEVGLQNGVNPSQEEGVGDSLKRKQTRRPTVTPEPPAILSSNETLPQCDNLAELPHLPELPASPVSAQTIQEVLEMGSLAYFAKGPLSRARANLHLDGKDSVALEGLLAFLKNSLLSFPSMDKKYRESIPNKIRSLPIAGFSDDNVDDIASSVKPAKKRKRKSTRLGKDGLWPSEEDYIARWWKNGDDESGSNPPFENSDIHRSRRIAHLRVRETELQLILVLETLALQAHSKNSDAKEHALSRGQIGEIVDAGKTATVTKLKKPQDLNLNLDLLIDRLCIWQSVGNEDSHSYSTLNSGTTSLSQLSATDQTGLHSKMLANETGEDHLRDFCAEVILPFYTARLPEKCAALHQKLGGHASPTGPVPLKSSTSSRIPQRPGEITKRTMPRKPRKTLERVLTEERKERASSQRPSIPPSLTRSVTAPAVPGIKRENSEISLSAVPERSSQGKVANRTGIQNSRRFGQREVDLSAAAKANDALIKRKATVAEDLKNAITALKKPNRGLAVKELVEFSEKRALSNHAISRGFNKAAGTITGCAVQVMATPRGNRKRDVFIGNTPTRRASDQSIENSRPLDSCIPSSGVRYRGQQEVADQGQSERPDKCDASTNPGPDVQETPCRRTSKFPPCILDSTIKVPVERSQKQEPSTPKEGVGSSRASKENLSAFLSLPIGGREQSSISDTPSKQMLHGQQPLGATLQRGEFSRAASTHSEIQLPVNKVDHTGEALIARYDEFDEQTFYRNLGWDD
ncbi:MAG: hypothetical protein M1837_005627 [Sclerophora amabilis]|nr:MAG: hypothetical protein M1837_005627 [Sclerophora amabilis]